MHNKAIKNRPTIKLLGWTRDKAARLLWRRYVANTGFSSDVTVRVNQFFNIKINNQ
jgi:hypothetical protein